MAVTNAKVQLDLLSIPSDQRRLERLGSDQASLNKTFWVNRVGPDGKTAKAFLCKPANPAEREPDGTLSRGGNGLPTGEPMPSGGPRGGEVAREALSGRAALILAAQTSIDIGMPETHVVKLGPQFMPGGDGQNVDDFTCSVQEARPSVGSLKDVDRNRLNADQVAGMAIFDTITLNTDRHAGNVLVDADGNLIPIDHGESFAEPTKGGLARVKVTLGGPHNALLGIPAAHEPMSPKILKGLKALDPGAFAASLTGDRDRVADVHRDMGEMISDGAVEMARRSAEFVRLATRSKIPLSPAAIQVTLGCAADELLDPAVNRKDFTKRAEKLIARAAIEQDAIKQVCLSSGGEYQVLCEQVRALGWQVQDRFMAPAMDALIDPVAMLSVVTNGTRRPAKQKFQIPAELAGGRNANDEQKAKLKVLREAFAAKEKADDALFMDSLHDQLSPAMAAATIMNIRNSGISRLLAVVEPAKVAEFKQSAARAELLPASEQAGAFGTLSIAMDAAARGAVSPQSAAIRTGTIRRRNPRHAKCECPGRGIRHRLPGGACRSGRIRHRGAGTAYRFRAGTERGLRHRRYGRRPCRVAGRDRPAGSFDGVRCLSQIGRTKERQRVRPQGQGGRRVNPGRGFWRRGRDERR